MNNHHLNPVKQIVAALSLIVAVAIAAAVCAAFLHSNSVQNFQVIQSVSGAVDVRSDGGYYFRAFPKIWTYPKVNTVFFSNEVAESRDQDGVQVRFSNKGEAEKQNLVMQKERTEAQYQQQIAESKGKAEVEKIKAVTDAERQKELAEIEAKKAVSVAELAKQQAAIEANKKLEVAEIQRKEEEQKLEIIRIQAEQKVAEAQAKQKEIELSGAITEQERVRLEIEKETQIGVAAAWAGGIAQMKLPETLMLGNGGGKEGSAVTDLINLMTIEKAKEVSGK